MGSVFGYAIGLVLAIILCALHFHDQRIKAQTYVGRSLARVTEKGYTNRDCYLRFVYFADGGRYDGVAVVSSYRYAGIHVGDRFMIQFDTEDPFRYYVDDRVIGA